MSDVFPDDNVSVTGSELFGSIFDSACESEIEQAPLDLKTLLGKVLDNGFQDSQVHNEEYDLDSTHQPAFPVDLTANEADDWYPFKNKEVSTLLLIVLNSQ